MKDFLDCPVCELKHSLDISNMKWVLDNGNPEVTDTRYLECGFNNWNAEKYSYDQRPRMVLYFSKEQNKLLSYDFQFIKLSGHGLIESFGAGRMCTHYLKYISPYGTKKEHREYLDKYIQLDLNLPFLDAVNKVLARIKKLQTFA